MSSEVTAKLISLSLGKIQQSRQIKSGLNLRKSLLVASVLHKAKDIYMTEIRSRRNVDTSSDQLKPSKSKKPKFLSQKSLVEDSENHQTDSEDNATAVVDSNQNMMDDYEAETAAATAAIASDSILEQLAVQSEPMQEETDKENSPPESVTSTTTTSDKIMSNRLETLSVRPCLKRRRGQVDSYDSDSSESDSDSESQLVTKRTRLQDYDTDSDSDKQLTDDRTNQINSLVHIFSGFSTYAHPNTTSTTNDCGYNGMDKPATSCYTQSSSSTDLNTFSKLCSESIALTA